MGVDKTGKIVSRSRILKTRSADTSRSSDGRSAIRRGSRRKPTGKKVQRRRRDSVAKDATFFRPSRGIQFQNGCGYDYPISGEIRMGESNSAYPDLCTARARVEWRPERSSTCSYWCCWCSVCLGMGCMRSVRGVYPGAREIDLAVLYGVWLTKRTVTAI